MTIWNTALPIVIVLAIMVEGYRTWKSFRKSTYVMKTLPQGEIVLLGPMTKAGAEGYVLGYNKFCEHGTVMNARVLTKYEFNVLKTIYPIVSLEL